ncbi:hypothetical protein THTE_2906 [Thermogutta terrifontis]|uniref:Uncharacterized protein n=1 Tax=Thermogutta terrifontis TaxID=1331910 RepID=A0A286RHR9_9BACT|nr:hypothetical protein THTE_2906 [Thermogutta terrifontis]
MQDAHLHGDRVPQLGDVVPELQRSVLPSSSPQKRRTNV